MMVETSKLDVAANKIEGKTFASKKWYRQDPS
jgi:hypothetical protein